MIKQFIILNWLLLVLSACEPTNQHVAHSIEPQCIASQSVCFVDTSIGRFEVKFNLEKITSEVEFTINVSYQGKEKLNKLNGHIEGKNMFMGRIPLFFTKDPIANNYIAPTMLARCSEDEMTWMLWLTVQSLGNHSAVTEGKPSNPEVTTFFIEFDSLK